MTITSIGDLAMTFSNRLSNVRIRTEMNTLASELTTGRKSNLHTPLSGDLAPVAVIARSLSQFSAYETVIAESALFLTGVQNALSQVTDGLQSLAKAAIDIENSISPVLIGNFGKNAHSRFSSLVNTLNGSIAGRSLFAGADTTAQAVDNAESILDDLAANLPPGARYDDISSAVDTYFAAGGGFDAQRYLGAATPMAPFRVSPEDSLALDVTAQNSALREALSATAKAALLDRGVLSGDIAEQRKLIRKSGVNLFEAEASVVALRGDIGMVEARIDTAKVRNGAETASLEMARSALIGADPFQTATQLQAVQTQLETFYTLTARLSQLNLTGYLR